MSDILARDLNELEERLMQMIEIVARARRGHVSELRRLKPHVLGGNHCNSFLFIDVTPSIHNAINDAVCGVNHEKVS